MSELYQWQKECLHRWFLNKGRGIVQAVTGAGKTRLALAAADRMDKKCQGKLLVRIVVPTAALMRQWKKVLQEHGVSSISLCGAGQSPDISCKYIIYIANSARYRLARQILRELKEKKPVLLIADECHHYSSEQNQLIFEFLPHIKEMAAQFYSLGLTATLPDGENGRYLASVLGRKIYHYSMREAAKAKTVCHYDIFHIGLSFLGEEAQSYQELTDRMLVIYRTMQSKGLIGADSISRYDLFEQLRAMTHSKNAKIAQLASSYLQLSYKRKELVCLAATRIPCVCRLIELLGIREKIMIFGERISQVEELYKYLNEQYPGRVGRYHYQMGKQANHNALQRFHEGEYRILITCKAVDEGVDVPDIAVGIVLSGTSVQRQRIQRLGRIVRTAEGKERAALYYLHLSDSSEEQMYLPDVADMEIFELEYEAEEDSFIHPEYDRRAHGLLEQMKRSGADLKVLAEADRVLDHGRVRADWKNKECDYAGKKADAKHMREKNYWVCMEKLSGKG
ncbi:MAG: DEAD/DEAH box helicase [Eubacteriales bacterium]|nr:DEAD/DEAH box helicase [Eubacteriales bacterium]